MTHSATLNRDALALNEATDITLSGDARNTVVVNGTISKLTNNKITLTAKSTAKITLSQDTTVYISNVAVDPTSVEVTFGETTTLKPVFTPTNAATQTVTWTSDNEEVATVNSEGVVKAKKVGTATIKATATDLLGTYTGECNVTVVKANYDMSNAKWSETKEFTYDGSEKKVEVTGLPDGVTVSNYTGNTAKNAGSYTATATLSYDADNYNTPTIEDCSWNITKAGATVTAPTKKTDLTYTGTAQALVNAGSATGGEIQYKLDGGTYSTTIPTAINVGTYTVYYKVVGDANHNDIAEASVEVTIAKASLEIKADGQSVTYGSEAPTYTATATGLVNGETLNTLYFSGLTYSCEYTSTSNVGTYDITISNFDAVKIALTNYDVTFTNGTLTVSKAKQTLSLSATTGSVTKPVSDSTTFTVSGAQGTVSVSVTAKPESAVENDVTASYDSTNNTVTITVTSNATVGKYTITVSADGKVDENQNYDSATATFEVEVKSAQESGN